MNYAIIENKLVVNVAISESPLKANWIASDVAAIGDIYENGEFKKSPIDLEALAKAIRAERDQNLLSTDWTQAFDVPQATKDKWATYRQALRDIPQQSGFPQTVVWPTQPE